MVDLHCHILPGVDDGAATLEESLELARRARADGITDIVATPHNHGGYLTEVGARRHERSFISERVASLNRALIQAGIDVKVWPGAENQLDVPILMRARCEAGALCFLGDGSEFMLVEWPWHPDYVPPWSEVIDVISWLRSRGVTPILAHPERSAALRDDRSRLDELIDRGCWIQITAESLGTHRIAREHAWPMLERYEKAVIATDSHGLWRHSGLSKFYGLIAQRLGEARADSMKERAASVLASLRENQR